MKNSRQQTKNQWFAISLAGQIVLAIIFSLLAASSSFALQDATDQPDPTTSPVTEAQPALFNRYDALDPAVIRSAEKLSDAFKAVADLAKPSVVRMVGYTSRGEITGSGFVIRRDGYLVTNNHVVEPVSRLYVEFTDNTSYPAEVVGRDPLTDLAVVHIDRNDLKPVRFTNDTNPEVGQWVVAIGCPLGLQQTVTAGIISAKDRHLGIIGERNWAGYEDYIQTDAAINKGNSGGPLFNLRGEVVGVNSAIVTQTGGSDGLGFAIPATIAKQIVDELRTTGRVRRGLIGVGIQDLTPTLAESYGLSPKQHGVLITSVNPKYPASKAGLKIEDIITAVDQQPIINTSQLRNFVSMHKPDTQVLVGIIRNGKQLSYPVTLAALDNQTTRPVIKVNNNHRPDLGVEFANARTDQPGEIVAYVSRVIPGGLANVDGLQRNDVIEQVNGKDLATLAKQNDTTPADYLDELLNRTPRGNIIRFKVNHPVRGGGFTVAFIAVKLP